MIEGLHLQFIHVVKAQCGKRVMPKNEKSLLIDFISQFPHVELYGQNRINQSLSIRLNVSTPKAHFDDLCIVK